MLHELSKPGQTGMAALLALLALVTMLVAPPCAAQGDSGDWYRIDVIVFAPSDAGPDVETAPDASPAYPADMVAIAAGDGPRPHRLSQLEQLHRASLEDGALPPIDHRQPDGFAFEGDSEAALNQRLIEALTRRGGPARAPGASPHSAGPGDSGASYNGASDTAPALDLDALFPDGAGSDAFTAASRSSMANVAARLRQSPQFDLLAHRSWIQPVGGKPAPVMIQAGQQYDDVHEIEGTLSISRSRFLHVQARVWRTLFEPRRGPAEPFPSSLPPDLPQDILDANEDLVAAENRRGQFTPSARHVMSQSRRMRSGELHYLDHPLLGVLVRASRHRR